MDGTYTSHVQFYKEVYGHALQEVRQVGRVGAAMGRSLQAAGDWSDAPTPDIVISRVMQNRFNATVDVGAGTFLSKCRPNMFLLIPPGISTTVLVDRPHEICFLSLPYARLRAFAAEESGLPVDGDFGRLHTLMIEDSLICRLLDQLWVEGQAGRPHGSLGADGIALQIAARLLSMRDGAAAAVARQTGLGPGKLRQVRERIEASLEEDFDLEDLASVVGLSPWHFARCFKAATGLGPAAYVMRLRVERAKQLLNWTSSSLVEIALACGFANQSHFTTAFKRHTGITPGAFRRGRGS